PNSRGRARRSSRRRRKPSQTSRRPALRCRTGIAGGALATTSIEAVRVPGRVVRETTLALGRHRFYWRMLMPALAVLFAVTLAPTAFLLITSLTPLDLTK